MKDIERMADKDVDLGKVGGSKLDYGSLAKAIARSRRSHSLPSVKNMSLQRSDDGLTLSLSGMNLGALGEHDEFPFAMVNHKPARIVTAGPDLIALSLEGIDLRRGSNELAIALDPYSIIRMELKA